MLTELWVTNLAVVDRLEARFRPGLNALTGETGAGKSLVVGALDLVLGGRASADLVRQGAGEAEIVARFELQPDHFLSRGLDQPLEDGALVLRRVISADGRSRAYVNDRPSTVTRLREIGAALADLHGQHEQQNLLREETHLDYLDAYAENAELLDAVKARHAAYVDTLRRRDEFAAASRKSAEERDYLRFQFEELESAHLREGENEELERERHVAAHAGRLAEAVQEAMAALTEDDPSSESLLGRASRSLGQAAAFDETLEPLRRQLDEALVATEETARELARYLDTLHADPARLEDLEARLDLITRLRKKHHGTLADLILRREELRATVEGWEEAPERLAALEREVGVAGKTLLSACAALTAARSKAAAAFAREVTRELTGLGMEHAKFSVEFTPPRQGARIAGREHLVTARGAEEARFVLAPNPGESAGPLSRIASGGEASRVMLALKNVLRNVDPVPLVIFDEVDAGIGGLVAEAVGSRLAAIARERQVLVVTHLAVIAGRAGHHLRLVKTVDRKRTRIAAEEVSGAEREEELARMLAGSAGGDDARRTARAILSGGRRS